MLKLTACCAAYLGAGALLAQVSAPAPSLPDNIEVNANIAYDQYPETKLDVYRPKETVRGKRPGVILIHGGGWVQGSKDELTGVARRFLDQGFVVCNVEYRLAKSAKAPAAVSDVLKATEWFFDNAGKYGVDNDRIVTAGASAGGHLALMTALVSKNARLGPTKDIAAVINFYGVTNIADLLSGPNARPEPAEWLPEEGRAELAARLSPLTYVTRDAPPVMTVHGDADPIVPYEHGIAITRALREVGIDAVMYPVAGGGHGGFDQAKTALIYDEIFRFLRKHGVMER